MDLVTAGRGFIGSCVVDALVAGRIAVRVLADPRPTSRRLDLQARTDFAAGMVALGA